MEETSRKEREMEETGIIYGSDGSVIGAKYISDREFLAPLLSDEEEVDRGTTQEG